MRSVERREDAVLRHEAAADPGRLGRRGLARRDLCVGRRVSAAAASRTSPAARRARARIGFARRLVLRRGISAWHPAAGPRPALGISTWHPAAGPRPVPERRSARADAVGPRTSRRRRRDPRRSRRAAASRRGRGLLLETAPARLSRRRRRRPAPWAHATAAPRASAPRARRGAARRRASRSRANRPSPTRPGPPNPPRTPRERRRRY